MRLWLFVSLIVSLVAILIANGSLTLVTMDDSAGEGGNISLLTRILIACNRLLQRLGSSRDSISQTSSLSSTQMAFHNQDRGAIAKSQGNKTNDRRKTLHDIIEDGSFWTMPDTDTLRTIKSEFPRELNRLKNASFVRTSNASRPEGLSIAESLYGQDYPEIDRTLVGVLALRWLHNNDYETFVGTQSPPPVVLRRESFAWLQRIFDKGLKTTEDTYALITSMVTNDLGKDPSLASDYARLMGIDISKVNHDMILYHAVDAGMVPSLDRLAKEDKDYLLLGIKLGSDFNFGQLAQAENAPASLSGLLEMRGHDRAFEMRFMEQILDLAGAAGHEDWTCAKKMIEPIFQSYKNVYDVAHAIIHEHLPLKNGYDIILTRKLELLRSVGFAREMDIQNPHDRALMRLFCLGNSANVESGEIFYTAFTDRISDDSRAQLIRGLNVHGSIDEPAVQATYIPAMFTKAMGNTPSGSLEEKINAVAAILRYLGRCMVVDDSAREKLPPGVTVIERDVRKIIPVLDSEEFRRKPEVLDGESIPDGQVANMAS